MRFFYDTEFIEDGHTIDLVSIAIVAEDGREYYAISSEFDASKANSWVRANVLAKLPPQQLEAAATTKDHDCAAMWKTRAQIRTELLDFFTHDGSRVELWAWVGGYDHVVLAQLFGEMSRLPAALPHYTNELKQYWYMAGKPRLPRRPEGTHDALVDARYARDRFLAINEVAPLDHRTRMQVFGKA